MEISVFMELFKEISIHCRPLFNWVGGLLWTLWDERWLACLFCSLIMHLTSIKVMICCQIKKEYLIGREPNHVHTQTVQPAPQYPINVTAVTLYRITYTTLVKDHCYIFQVHSVQFRDRMWCHVRLMCTSLRVSLKCDSICYTWVLW